MLTQISWDRYNLDVAAYNEVILAVARDLPHGREPDTEQRQEMEVAGEVSKTNLKDKAPEGYLVQKVDIQVAQAFVCERTSKSRTQEALLGRVLPEGRAG